MVERMESGREFIHPDHLCRPMLRGKNGFSHSRCSLKDEHGIDKEQ